MKEEGFALWEERVRANRRPRATCKRTERPLRREWKGGEPAEAGREGGNWESLRFSSVQAERGQPRCCISQGRSKEAPRMQARRSNVLRWPHLLSLSLKLLHGTQKGETQRLRRGNWFQELRG